MYGLFSLVKNLRFWVIYRMLKADMIKKQKTTVFLSVAVLIGLAASLLVASTVSHDVLAATCGKDSDGKALTTAVISCDNTGGNAIWGLLIIALNVLTGGIGIVAVGGIVYASILYASAGDNSGQVSKAKNMIRDIVIGIVAYALMYSLLQYLIPGGAFA